MTYLKLVQPFLPNQVQNLSFTLYFWLIHICMCNLLCLSFPNLRYFNLLITVYYCYINYLRTSLDHEATTYIPLTCLITCLEYSSSSPESVGMILVLTCLLENNKTWSNKLYSDSRLLKKIPTWVGNTEAT